MAGSAAPRRILVTSVGTGVGNAIVTAAEASEHPYRVIGINTETVHAGNFRCAVSYPGPRSDRNTSAFVAVAAEVARAEQAELVLCGRDSDLVALAAPGLPDDFPPAPDLVLRPARAPRSYNNGPPEG